MINCTCNFDSRVTVGLNCVWVDKKVLVRARFKLFFKKKNVFENCPDLMKMVVCE